MSFLSYEQNGFFPTAGSQEMGFSAEPPWGLQASSVLQARDPAHLANSTTLDFRAQQ